jgi:hypothetical protein
MCPSSSKSQLCSMRPLFLAAATLILAALAGGPATAQTHENHKLVAPDGVAMDYFGYDLSISGDVALIGAYCNDEKGYDAGAAYVFRYSSQNNSWDYEDKLLAPDGMTKDLFGHRVALSGDVALVGAVWDDDKGFNSGSAYVFRYIEATDSWEYEDKLVAGDGAALDFFGKSVALSGDVALIGAYGSDEKGSEAGAAYVFRYTSGSGWTQEDKLLADDGTAGDQCGYTVAISGDLALLGSPLDDDNGTDSGSAYVFRYNVSGPGWDQEDKLLAGNGAAGDLLGESVAICDDVAVIGAHCNDETATDAGAAYVFRRDSDNLTWNQADRLLAGDGASGDHFGSSVAVSGDIVLVGAYKDDDAVVDAGSAYLFRFQGGTGKWHEERKFLASDGAPDDCFGHYSALFEDTALIGAYYDDDNGYQSGSAYIYDLDPILDIKCNGLDSNVAVPVGNKVRLDIDLKACRWEGGDADVWCIVDTPFPGSYAYFSYGPMSSPTWGSSAFPTGSTAYFSGSLTDLNDTINDKPLPLGLYKAHFAFDNTRNGILTTADLAWIMSNPWAHDVVDFEVKTIPCYYKYDDGTSEDLLGITDGGDLCWMHRFDAVAGCETIYTIQTIFGSPQNPGLSPPNGTDCIVYLWDDLDDNGDPNDNCVLRTFEPTTVQNRDTDIMNIITLKNPWVVTGEFYVGCVLTHSVGQFVVPIDGTTPYVQGDAWFCGTNVPGGFDPDNLAGNMYAPMEWGHYWCLRACGGS